MRRITISCCALFLVVGIVGQGAQARPADSKGDAKNVALAHLKAHAHAYGLRGDLSDLRVTAVLDGIATRHVHVQQMLNGLPIQGATLSVELTKDNIVTSADRAYLGGVAEAARPASATQITAARAIAAAKTAIGFTTGRGAARASLMYISRGGTAVKIWRTTVPALRPLGDWLVYVDAYSARALAKHNRLLFDTGSVFPVSPRVSGYTGPVGDCDTAAHAAELAPYQVRMDLLGLDPETNQLRGQYADLTAPGLLGGHRGAGVAQSISRTFVYPCNDDRFDETMAYYQIDRTQRLIQSLGFTPQNGNEIYASAIPVHAHYEPGDNAFYSPEDLGLHFGDGDSVYPVDQAEDADTIIHEYGHAILSAEVRDICEIGDTLGLCEGGAMHEGFGDLLAGLVTGNACMFEWTNSGATACNGSPGLRNLDNTKTYADWADEVHDDGEIWGGTIWDIAQSLSGVSLDDGVPTEAGRNRVLRTLLEMHLYLMQNPTFTKAAKAFVEANRALYGGADESAIRSRFAARGISTTASVPLPLALITINHQWIGDLGNLKILVGPSPGAPVCQIAIPGPGPANGATVFSIALSVSPCASFLPPSSARPWRLSARDKGEGDVGSIRQFRIVMGTGSSARVFSATDTPIMIPDGIGDSPGRTAYSVLPKYPKSVWWGAHNTPKTMEPGTTTTVDVGATNAGGTEWTTSCGLSYHWRNLDGTIVVASGTVTPVAAPVAFGQATTLAARVTAPADAGRYVLLWDMECGGRHFSSLMGRTNNVTVVVAHPLG